MTKDDFERQTEKLARELPDAIDRWDDPDDVAAREAYEAEKEARQREAFELSYLVTGQRKPSETLEHAIFKMTTYFSDELERGGDTRQPLPRLDTGEAAELVVVGHYFLKGLA